MATYFGVGTGTWDNANTGIWATTSGGATGAGPPTASDDVILDGSSGSITTGTSAVCRSLDCTAGTGNYASTLTLGAAWTIGNTSTANGSGVALKFVAGMTFSSGANAVIIQCPAASTVTVTSAGMTFAANVTLQTGKFTLTDKFVTTGVFATSTGSPTLTAQGDVTCLAFNANSSTGTTNMGSGLWTLTRTTTVTIIIMGGTLNAGGSTLLIQNGAAAGQTLTVSPKTYNNLTIGAGAGTVSLNGAMTLGTLTLSAGSTTTIAGTQTVTTLVATGTGAAAGRITLKSTSAGVQQSISQAVGTVNASWLILQDTAGTGGATFNATETAIISNVSGWNVTSQPVFYAVGSGTWDASSTAIWALTSGGATGAGVPTVTDDVILDSNSGAVTVGASVSCRSIDCTAGTGNYTSTLTLQQFTTTIGGASVNPTGVALKMAPGGGGGMTLAITGTPNITFNSSSTTSVSITTAGINILPNSGSTLTISNGGRYTLADDLTITGVISTGTASTQITANGNVTAQRFAMWTGSPSPAPTLNMGGGTWTATNTGTANPAWQMGSTPIVNASTSTISVAAWAPVANNNPMQFQGGGKVYNNLSFPNFGIYSITGANTFNTLTIGPTAQLQLPASTTTIITGLSASGRANGYVYEAGLGASGFHYITSPSATPLNITGSLTLDVSVAPTAWTSAAGQNLLTKWNTSTHGSYQLSLGTTGIPTVNVCHVAPTAIVFTASASTTSVFSAGQQGWVRASLVVNNGTNSVCTFYTSPDGSTWTQLGTTVSASIPSGTLVVSTGDLEIGSQNTGTQGSQLVGVLNRARVYASALGSGSGTPVFDADLTIDRFALAVGATNGFTDTAKSIFNEGSANAAAVTLKGTNILGDGRASIVSSTPGTTATLSCASGTISCNYLSVQDITATGGASFYAGAASANVSNNVGWNFTNAPGGGTTINLSQGQALSLQNQVIRSVPMSQGQNLALVKASSKTTPMTQGTSLTVLRGTFRTITFTQGTSLTALHGTFGTRTITLTQAQSLSSTRSASLGKTVTVTQGQQVTITKSVGHTNLVAQGQALTSTKRINKTVSMTQAQSLASTRTMTRSITVTQGQAIKNTSAVSRSFAIAQGQILSTHRSVGHTVGVTQGSSASLVKGIASKHLILAPGILTLNNLVAKRILMSQPSILSMSMTLHTIRPLTISLTQGQTVRLTTGNFHTRYATAYVYQTMTTKDILIDTDGTYIRIPVATWSYQPNLPTFGVLDSINQQTIMVPSTSAWKLKVVDDNHSLLTN